MAVVLVDAELVDQLAGVLAAIAGGRRIGLYQNDWTPQDTDTIARVQPCDFPGYAGLQTITAWSAPTLIGNSAQAEANPVTWTRGVGVGGNWIFGVYIVDSGGVLRWAERNPSGPVAMVGNGQVFGYTPRLSLTSRY